MKPRDPSPDQPDHEQSRTHLKPEDIMQYEPKATGVALFIKHISQIADLHGTSAFLKQLPLCMCSEAMEWYASLEEDTTEWMAHSLHLWASELCLCFQKDRLQCREEADRLQFSFAREDTLSLRQYITQKRNLYDESGLKDTDEIVHHLWRGLDPILMNSIRPYDTGNNMTNFCTALYEQEYSARQVWRSQHQMMTRTYSARSSFSPISPVNHRNLGKPLPRPPTLSSATERPAMPGSHIAQSHPRQRERDCRH